MKAPDVNVLVAAFRISHPHHEIARTWLVDVLRSGEPLGLAPAVATGVVRILTHPRLWSDGADSTGQALDHLDQLRRNPSVIMISPGPRHWEIFADLCRQIGAQGSIISDVARAAVAIEHGATWIAFDRDFARFPGLHWEVPGQARRA